MAHLVTGLAAAWTVGASLYWGTLTAGGADSYGFISQAALWLRGDLVVEQPLATQVSWPHADWTLSPLGYRPGPERGTIVPVYPAGLPIVMAGLQAIGGPLAVFLAVPLLGGLLIIAGASLASRVASPAAGTIAALLLAASPTMLFSSMWPMSDVPAAAWWTLAVLLVTMNGARAAAGGGVCAALAILTRPNLFALALAPALYLAARIRTDDQRGVARARFIVFSVLASLGCAAVAGIHLRIYGSPFSTGYGSLDQVYALANASEAVPGFVTRPLGSEPALVLCGLAGTLALFGVNIGRSARGTAYLCLGVIALVLGSYAFYVSFPEWWYLRFLLPAFPAIAALGGAGVLRLMTFVPARARGLVLGAIGLSIVTSGLWEARERDVFGLREAELRYQGVARFVRRALPANAVFFAFQHSGSLRYYADRPTVRFDLMASGSFVRSMDRLRELGYRPYFVVEDAGEREVFRFRFHHVDPRGNLDWPPLAELPAPARVRIYDPDDLEKWRAGAHIATEIIRP